MAKSRGISADIQSPRTKLLFTIYSAPNSKIKAEPGIKSSLSQALGYKSVTDIGKKEFALHETALRSNYIMIAMGIAIIFFTFALQFGILPQESAIFFGITLIVVGTLFLLVSRKNRPKLPATVKALLKELSRH
jgi:multidrug efflux pump subunit AcrB